MLLQLEQECLDIYRRKVEKTKKHRADLCQTLNEAETEVSSLVSALGEHANFVQVESFLHCCFFVVIIIIIIITIVKNAFKKIHIEIQRESCGIGVFNINGMIFVFFF